MATTGKKYVHIEYCGGWGGYEPAANKALAYLQTKCATDGSVEFALKKDDKITNNFEIFVNGELVHSKRKNRDGFLNNTAKKQKMVAAIEDADLMDSAPANFPSQGSMGGCLIM